MPVKMFLILACLLGGLLSVSAQTNGVPTALPGVPATSADWFTLLITGLTPLVIAFVKWVAPKIPKVILPLIAPLVGIALDQLVAAVTSHQGNVFLAALAGGAGVWLRELADQSKKLASPPTP